MIKSRTIFGKFFSTFMLINILSFVLLTVTITAIVDTSINTMMTESLKNAADSVISFLSKDNNGEFGAFADYIDSEREDLDLATELLASNDDSLLILFVNDDGKVIHCGGSPKAELNKEAVFKNDDYVISKDVKLLLEDGQDINSTDTMDGFFKKEHAYYGIPIIEDGIYYGAVIASSSRTDSSYLTSTMVRTVFMAVLWIMLAALVAVYFISDRLTSPLKDMSKAAKSFANGQFDARVTVVGTDEIAELATAFNNMAASLQTSEDLRRTFLANISHDLRTPMTTISGFIDGILDGAIPPEKHEYYLGVIATEVRRLSRLVSQLLDISRLEAGERKFNMQSYDICEQAREIIISNIQRLEEKDLNVSFDCTNDNIMIVADKDAIHQIFYNICDNAIKFAATGGKYSISIEEKEKQVYVSVFNEGEGISPDDLPYVFERFYKSDKSRGIDKTGVGLGMYIARTIIEAHGQKIYVESEYGKWCRFTFTLKKSAKNTTRVRMDDND